MSFGCERSCSGPRKVPNFNSNVPQGGIYPHINFERDPLNIFRVRALTSSGSTGGGGGDAKTIISPNTSFGDIITLKCLELILCFKKSTKVLPVDIPSADLCQAAMTSNQVSNR